MAGHRAAARQRIATGNDLLLLVGAEPDTRWRAFTDAVVDLALQFGTRMVVGLGAYPAAVPHTRPTLLVVHGQRRPSWPRLALPARAPSTSPPACRPRSSGAAPRSASRRSACGPRSRTTPSAMAYPAASLALLEGLRQRGGRLGPDRRPGRRGGRRHGPGSTRIIADNPEHAEMVEHLEREADDQVQAGPLPSGDELAAELEQFLREQGD